MAISIPSKVFRLWDDRADKPRGDFVSIGAKNSMRSNIKCAVTKSIYDGYSVHEVKITESVVRAIPITKLLDEMQKADEIRAAEAAARSKQQLDDRIQRLEKELQTLKSNK